MTAPVLRPAQARVLRYSGGLLTVSAVPGAGKTFVLSALVEQLIAEGAARPDELLVLTYMRAAAQSLRARITARLAGRGLAADGLTVTTLHAFAQDLLRRFGQAPAALVDDAARRAMLETALAQHLRDGAHRARFEAAFGSDDSSARRRFVEMCARAIAAAKAHGLDAVALAAALAPLPYPELADLAGAYESELAARGAWDLDDLVRRALSLLRQDPQALARCRARWRFVLEDEAQDATPAQNELLELLAGGPERGHRVRVGDANQAITGTFTFTDPAGFRDACRALEPLGRHVTMDESGRSGAPILALANALVAFSSTHPDARVAQAFMPVAARAAAGCPPVDACRVHFFAYETPDHEALSVVAQARLTLASGPAQALAVLCYRNATALRYAALLAAAGVPVAAAEAPGTPGAVTVSTLHRAKGLEFDAVWLPELGCHSGRLAACSDFPWALDELRLRDEPAALVMQAVASYARGERFEEAAALERARAEAVAERLRLLYVGLTRARRCLTLSCTAGLRAPAPPAHVQHLAGLCLALSAQNGS